MGQIEARLSEIAKLIQSEQDANALRLHVEQMLESSAFSTSRRSGQFLQYIVEKAIAQDTDALKERTIGIEVFHRPHDYDTGEDAIVRVTASDVRRRLALHYSKEGRLSDFKVSLPPGGYAPEIYRELPLPSADTPLRESSPSAIPSSISLSSSASATDLSAETHRSPRKFPQRTLIWCSAAIFVALLSATLLKRLHPASEAGGSPWSLLFSSGKPLLVILADPDLNEIQLLTGKYVSLSDYANGRLGCETLKADLQNVCKNALRGDKVATVDANAIAKIGVLAEQFHSSIEPRAARMTRLTDLQTDRNVILLGSRVANPWTDLFREKLDFYVDHDAASGLQVVHNMHPRQGEAEVYLPTAGPYGTGDNYTLISFLPNLIGTGHALLLTGATHEGMDAAMMVALDQKVLSRILDACDARESHFQVLLRLRMMAGSPLTVETVACHKLSAH